MTTQPEPRKPSRNKVVIVGAGIGGLTLGGLLERAGIDYVILERSQKASPLGSAISVGSNVLQVFQQLGIADKIKANSKTMEETNHYNEKGELLCRRSFRWRAARYGEAGYFLARPVLHELLASLIPTEKLKMGTKVVSIIQDKDGVTVNCDNGSTYRGDILVGADGARSSVRRSLFEQLDREGLLPESDKGELEFTNTCIVGTTNPMDPEKYPFHKKNDTHYVVVMDDKIPFTVGLAKYDDRPADNKICWMVMEHLEEGANQSRDGSQNLEWGAGAAETMCDRIRDYPFTEGISVGDLIDQTPKGQISKVMLEEKLFETWYHSRTVLLGDACHKMHPAAGLGAVNAIHDATVLSSWLFELESNGECTFEQAFRAYKEERYPRAAHSFNTSRGMSKTANRRWFSGIVRKVFFYMPNWVVIKIVDQMEEYRPQASFLPLVPDKGSLRPIPQESLKLAEKHMLAQAL
ncbi:hypothetical protein BGW38_000880 [Lunasporangiospora selenospora]|uniref:FAD-binding domain-containing protein n=1 Tax=Lunasporangiospora selenospora TaxID=979761 RepID=A0A9P6G3Q3_9FUNG|nr:hypothetical protein BGW38_000880 [Lunasporangiospora selenospora]